MESGDVRGQKSCYDISRGGIIWQEKKKIWCNLTRDNCKEQLMA